jgi:hypothetical protein
MPANYILLKKITVGATGAATVTFSNLPQTGYTDLKISVSARTNVSSSGPNDWLTTSFNGSTSSLSFREIESNGTSSGAYAGSTGFSISGTTNGQTANTFSNGDIYIPNYTGSQQKAYSVDTVTETNGSSSLVSLLAGTWANTSAITSITFGMNTGTLFSQYSTFYLYGIAAVGTTPTSSLFAQGGDIITNDGTYWIHTFLSSGTFTPTKSLNCDLLVVAGGGGGGGSDSSGRTAGGGGGAGGYLEQASRSVTAGSYNVLIGAGGAQGISAAAATPSQVTRGFNGSNSIFAAVTAIGGGGGQGGGGNTALNGSPNTGGSGGGGGAGSVLFYNGAAATQGNSDSATGFGFAGGNGVVGGTGSYQAGAGGGGAGGVGGNSLSSSTSSGGNGGVGGAGKQSSITGTATYYAAGGSGANEGSNASNTSTNSIGGAGGRGATSTNPTAGVVNTGSGGGGSSYQGTGGTGGSGIVIIRYPMV